MADLFNKKVILSILIVLLSVSCEKNEQDDLLTGGTWMLDNGLISPVKESVTFNTDKTYIIESGLRTLRSGYFLTGTISGDWSRQGDQITFLTSILDLPDDTGSLQLIPAIPGVPIGSFYGHIISGIYRNDSSLIDTSGFIRFDEINDSGIFDDEDPDDRIWLIQKLTGDSLIVDAEGKILRYYRQQEKEEI